MAQQKIQRRRRENGITVLFKYHTSVSTRVLQSIHVRAPFLVVGTGCHTAEGVENNYARKVRTVVVQREHAQVDAGPTSDLGSSIEQPPRVIKIAGRQAGRQAQDGVGGGEEESAPPCDSGCEPKKG